jgi:hypothetical protein
MQVSQQLLILQEPDKEEDKTLAKNLHNLINGITEETAAA